MADPFKWQQDGLLGNPHETFLVNFWEEMLGAGHPASADECDESEASELTLLSARSFVY